LRSLWLGARCPFGEFGVHLLKAVVVLDVCDVALMVFVLGVDETVDRGWEERLHFGGVFFYTN